MERAATRRHFKLVVMKIFSTQLRQPVQQQRAY
jgi:hypothetical protein